MMSSTIELRFACADDIPDATDFVLLALNDVGMQDGCAELLGSEFINRLEIQGPQNTILALDKSNNDSIVGFLEINPEKSVKGHCFISTIYVLPSYRNQDIEKSLVHKMLEEKCQPGEELLVQVCLDCDLKYWEKLDFKPKSTILSLKK